jgi:hypothetical protein
LENGRKKWGAATDGDAYAKATLKLWVGGSSSWTRTVGSEVD